MNSINFDNPWLLLLLIPVLGIVITSFVLTINSENRTRNNVISFVIHIIIGLLVVLTITKTTLETVVTRTEIYILADVSYSSNSNLDLIDEYIETVEKNSPRNSKIGIICFGKDHQLLVDLGEDIISVKNANIDNSTTDMESALEYAASLFHDDVIKRIIIISDGEETNKSNISNLAQSLSDDNIYIDAMYLDNNIKENVDEIQINQIDYTSSTYLNEEENVSVVVQSNIDTRAIIKLYLNGEVYKEKALSLTKGFNSVVFDLNTQTSGINNYELKLESETDSSNFNNSYLFNQEVYEKLKVLFLTSSQADKNVAEEMYGDSAEIDFYYRKYDIPFTVEELSIYDEFVLSNVDIRNYYNHSQLVNSIDTLVSEFGKSLITIGNTYIQNNEDDQTLTYLSNMLPVKYGALEEEGKLVTILLDISRSMEFSSKLIIAKAAACSIVDNLDDSVTVAIIGFYGEVGTILSPMSAKYKDEIKDKINRLDVYQGTFMGAALEYTHEFMVNMPYDRKQVMLISDGLPYLEQESLSREKVKEMAMNNISLSTILTASATGEKLMRELANLGKGHAYVVNDVKDVESLIVDDVLNSLQEVILDSSASPVNIKSTKNDLLNGIESLPDVKGLYNNTAKSSSDVLLSVTYTDRVGSEYDVPLYTTWKYGNGKVSSFSSLISGEWTEDWHKNIQASKVLSNFVEANQPKERIDSAFITSSVTEGTITSIYVNAPTVNKNSKLNMSVKCPNGDIIEQELSFDSENYVADITTDQIGNYEVTITYKLGEMEYSTDYSFSISYLPEYNSFTLYEASNLYFLVSSNGKISEDGNLVIENNDSEVQKYIFDFTPIFMIICVVLFVIDVIIRKLRWQDIKSLFKSFKKENFYK